jgi:hypothetical protein
VPRRWPVLCRLCVPPALRRWRLCARSSCSTENFLTEIFGWSLAFEFSSDGSEKAWFFLRHIELDFNLETAVDR